MSHNSSLLVPLPEITRHKHSLFELDGDAAAKWLDALPMANLGETTKQLYQALTELSHVRCKPKDRLDILEKMRPRVHTITKGLAQHYLNKPIVLPDKAEKVVLLADTLNSQLALGYCQSFVGLESESRLIRPKESMATCLHRALSEYSQVLLRTYQLYRTPPHHFWLHNHHLYRSAQLQKLTTHKVSDKILGSGTVQQAYLRTLLLACSRCHQLPQPHIEQVYNGLRYWSNLVEIRGNRLESCTFLLDPDHDAAPTYRQLTQQAPSPDWLGIDTNGLTESDIVNANQPGAKTKLELNLPKATLMQLSNAWHAPTTRSSQRVERDDTALITLGLNATHYYCANLASFDQFQIDSDDAQLQPDPFSERHHHDVWSDGASDDTRETDHAGAVSFGLNPNQPDEPVEAIDYSLTQTPGDNSRRNADREYSYLRAQILDSSAGGFRIEWPLEQGVRIRTGEVIGIKTEDFDDWRIAVVRWIRGDEQHQMGVEVLATSAIPYSARLMQSGLPASDYQRAIVLPGDGQDDSPRVLLANIASFAEGQTIELIRPGHAQRARLLTSIESSGSYKLFGYKDAVKNAPPKAVVGEPEKNEGEFNNLWEIL